MTAEKPVKPPKRQGRRRITSPAPPKAGETTAEYRKRTTPKDELSECHSCGMEYEHHPGLITTCREKREAISLLKMVRERAGKIDRALGDEIDTFLDRMGVFG